MQHNIRLSSVVTVVLVGMLSLASIYQGGSPSVAQAAPATVTFRQNVNGYLGAKDGYITNQYGTGGASVMTGTDSEIRNSSTENYSSHTLVRFDNLNIPAGSSVTSASLTLRMTAWEPFAIQGLYLNTPWDPAASGLSWTKRDNTNSWATPGATGAGTDTVAGKSFSFNVTDAGSQTITVNLDPAVVNSWVNSPSSNQGVVLFLGSSVANGGLVMLTSENGTATNRPMLSVTYDNNPDISAPSVPASLAATAVSPTQINLSWQASTDDVAVAGYRVYRDGNQIATTTGTSHSDTGLTASTTYSYTVAAFDGAGNASAQSDAASATTLEAPPADTTPPVISGISSSNITQTSAAISWNTDEASDTQVEYGTSTSYGSMTALNGSLVTSHSASLSGLTASTLYHYRVLSRDQAGNLSVSSDQTFTTQAPPPPGGTFENVVWVNGFLDPTTMTFAPDGRLFVAEQRGQLRIIKNGVLLASPFLSLSVDINGERGLLGIAFDPNFAVNRYIYLYYTPPTGINRVSRFTASASNPDVVEPGSELVILDNIVNVQGYHNGGAIHFGSDNMLYVAVGDGHTESNAQNLGNLAGKILRINPNAYPNIIPADNPFLSVTGARGEIWAYGFRNPFTFAVEPGTGKIHINDVGGDNEEINLLERGKNFAWPNCVGPCDPTYQSLTYTDPVTGQTVPYVTPVYYYRNNGPFGCAITGGTFYRGSQFPSEYVGTYFFGDYCYSSIRHLDLSYQATNFASSESGTVDVKQGPDGSIYVLNYAQGRIKRISYTGGSTNQMPTAVISASPLTASSAPATVNFDGSGSTDPDNDTLTYAWDFGDGSPTESGAQVSHTYASAGQYQARLTVNDGNGGQNSAVQIISVGNAPIGSIDLPPSGATYRAGDTINFSGSATDSEDGNLPASAFSWEIVFHHDTHTHPFLSVISGTTSGSFVIPDNGEPAANVWYRVNLTVTDSSGLTHTTFRDVTPVTSNITIATVPAGLQILLDSQPHVAPYSVSSVVGMNRDISVNSPQTFGGKNYAFVSWSNGGPRSQTIVTPETATTYTAVFQEIDGTVPSIPGGLVATSTAPAAVQLTWNPSTDNVGVEGYQVFRCQGSSCTPTVQVATTTATSHFDSNLLPGTLYRYRVRAFDAAGNVSGYSAIRGVTTQKFPDTTPPTTSVTRPNNNAIVKGTVTISATASDPTVTGQIKSGIASLSYLIDGNVVASVTTGSLSTTYNTLQLTNGAHQVTSVAADKAGNTATSAPRTITVNN